MLYQLVIKGEPECAMLAAQTRDVTVIEIQRITAYGETIALADLTKVGELRLQHWFTELPLTPSPGGFKTGTLLFYQPYHQT